MLKLNGDKQWCRFCDTWHKPWEHECTIEDLISHVVKLDKRASHAEHIIDLLLEVLADARPHNCDGLHHSKKDQHTLDEPCPILSRIDAALEYKEQKKR
jgi:hypothetical protein